jgi:uncharacterized membrane protein YedE/YeeE
MDIAWIHALSGGVLIGIAVSLMLLWNGRATGISGIIYGAFRASKADLYWRLSFICGLLLGGALLANFSPQVFNTNLAPSDSTLVVAGLFVGFGTVLGSGCTSGHGICGISRWSMRSIVATLLFILSGVVTVMVFRKLGGAI